MKKEVYILFLVLTLSIILFLSGCETLLKKESIDNQSQFSYTTGNSEKVYSDTYKAETVLSEKQKLIIKGAKELLGKTSLIIKGRSFNYDCTGTVLAVYYYAGIDLTVYFPRYRGNGVSRLYQTAADFNLFYKTSLPAPGDIIFWDNTYDRNSDKIWNDPLTHAGIVLEIDEDGTISYVHLNYAKGIIIEKMNLLNPEVHVKNQGSETYTYNSPMRMRSHRYINPTQWLSSHLNRGFGMLYKITQE